jgi:dihydropyrimidinase
MNVDYSCYEGVSVRGLPEVVMQRGSILVDHGSWRGTAGAGRFVPRSRMIE